MTKRADPSPSPWSHDPDEFGITGGPIRDAEGLEVARVYRLADAAVMAAAPEFLDACRKALETLRHWNGMHLSGEAERRCWEAYRASPEVRIIESALEKAGDQ